MKRLYTVVIKDLDVSAAMDLFDIAPAASKPITIHALYISQTNKLAVAGDEFIRYSVERGYTNASTGGSTATPIPVGSTGTAGFAARVGATGVASGGTGVNLHADSFHNGSKEALILSEDMQWDCPVGQRFVVRLPAPEQTQRINATLYVQEHE